MAIDRNVSDERQARLDAMVDEFRTAQRRRLVKRGKLHRAESARQATAHIETPPPEKVN
jgi:hypothetical protein